MIGDSYERVRVVKVLQIYEKLKGSKTTKGGNINIFGQ